MAKDPALRKFLEGDASAMSQIVALVSRIVHDRAYGVAAADRPDLIQQTLLDVWVAVIKPGFELRRDFEGFVATVAYRRCVDWVRRQRATYPVEDLPLAGGARPDHALARREKILLGRRVLGRLRESCRRLMSLRWSERLPYARIAERFDRTEGAVRNEMYNCLKAARRILDEIR